jgi:hypothetical protein
MNIISNMNVDLDERIETEERRPFSVVRIKYNFDKAQGLKYKIREVGFCL